MHVPLFLLLLCMVLGCEQKTQYEILTTIFTGVPPMEELYADKVPDEKEELQEITEKIKNKMHLHPLWAAAQCTACHVAGSDELLYTDSVNGLMPELIQPAETLCLKCHFDKTTRRAIRGRLWLHAPVARGECLSCHNAHQSPHQAHLRVKPGKICSSCHESNQLPQACFDNPRDGTAENECLNCHNAHMGRNSFLLKSDYIEAEIPAGPIPKSVEIQSSFPVLTN